MITKLICNNVELDLTTEFPISQNMTITDIATPDTKEGYYTKTIELRGTKTNNNFFEHIFLVNIETLSFNPNLKTSARIIKDDIEVLNGDLKLSNIRLKYVNDVEEIIYDCEIYGSNSTLFTNVSDDKLELLDISSLNHTYNHTNIINSWSSAIGTSYVYPLVDYGYNNFNNASFHIHQLRPAVPVKIYWDKIFAHAGKTYTSTFLNSNFFKRLYVPHNGESFSISDATAQTFQFYAGRLIDSSADNKSIVYNSFYSLWQLSTSYIGVGSGGALLSGTKVHTPNDDSTSPFNDIGNRYNTTTGIFTIGKNGWYNMKGLIKLRVKLNAPAGTASIQGNINIWVYLQKSVNGGTTWTFEGSKYVQGFVTPSTTYQTSQVSFEFPNIPAAGTNTFRIIYVLAGGNQNGGIDFKDGSNASITTGTASMDIIEDDGSYFSGLLADKSLNEIDTVVMNDSIPRDVKMRDFILSICKMFNLYFDSDKTNENNYIIEPRDDYYAAGTTQDWTYKIAYDKVVEIVPMGAVNNKTYKWSFKEDSDYFNKIYQDEFKESYGTKTHIINNDFLKDENKQEVIFSSTVIVDNPQNDMVLPKIFKYENGVVSPMKHNVRIIYYGGVKSCSQWTLNTLLSGSFNQTQYPFFGMVDDPMQPSVSIEFGVPNKLYYTYPAQQYTTNNLFNKYWYRTINEITDKDSKLLKAEFYLTELDINTFDFRDKIFIKDAYYIVNKIIDYNPLEDGLTKVELLKLKNYSAYVPVLAPLEDISNNQNNPVGSARVIGGGGNNEYGGNSVIFGDNVNVFSSGSIATGNNIYIGEDCVNCEAASSSNIFIGNNSTNVSVSNSNYCLIGSECDNIKLIDCENVNISGGISNEIFIGLKDLTIDETNLNEFNSYGIKKITLGGILKSELNQVTHFTHTSDSNVGGYEINYADTSGGNVTLTLPPMTFKNIRYTFKKVSNDANDLIIVPDSIGVLIDGASSYVINSQYDFVHVVSNGTEWLII